MVVTVSHLGYVQARAALDLPGAAPWWQGPRRMQTRDEDFVTRLFVANTHTPGAFFPRTSRLQGEGLAPAAGARRNRRQGADHILPLEQGELITTIMRCPRTRRPGASST